MKMLGKFSLVMSLALAVLLASCDYWGEEWYKNQKEDVVSSNVTSGSSGSSTSSGNTTTTCGTTQAVYTSYDSAGGYFNVEGGQYRTCTLTGNSQGGTITLSDGVLADLTGTYGTPSSSADGSPVALAAASSGDASVALAAESSVKLKIEGSWAVSFSGRTIRCSYSILVTNGMFALRESSENGTTRIYVGGNAAGGDASGWLGSYVASGSAVDPVNGTKWYSDSYSSHPYLFKDGGFYEHSSDGKYEYSSPYIVGRTSSGYKIFYNIREYSGEYNIEGYIASSAWIMHSECFTISSSSATEGDRGWEYHGYATVSYGSEYSSYSIYNNGNPYVYEYNQSYSYNSKMQKATYGTAEYNITASDHEVTQGEYEAYCNYEGNGSYSQPNNSYGAGANYPAYYVSWYDALVYCNLRSINEGLTPCYSIAGKTNPAEWPDIVNQSGKYCGPSNNKDEWNTASCNFNADGYRLPTSAEWEYLARGGSAHETYEYSGSDDISGVAWYSKNASKAHEVKGKNANSLGLYDMTGNVSEWCWDCKTDSRDGEPYYYSRIYCGGDWTDDSYNCAISSSSYDSSASRDYERGFRIVRSN